MSLTREELQAVVETVLDDIVMADDTRKDPGWLDTIMRAADAYADNGCQHRNPRCDWQLTPKAERELARWDTYARQQAGEPCT